MPLPATGNTDGALRGSALAPLRYNVSMGAVADGTSRGFILESTYRIESGRPVVMLYGKLDTGQPFLVREDRQTPFFYIGSGDAVRLGSSISGIEEDHPPKTNMAGGPVVRVRVRTPPDVPPLRDALVARGVCCYEADVGFAARYLIDRGIRGSMLIEHARPRTERGLRVFDNPSVRPCDWTPRLTVLAFDIETDPSARRLFSISLAGCGVEEVLLFTPRGYDCVSAAACFRSEKELLEAFVERVRGLDPDILTGWNVVDFDIATLTRIAERCGVPLALGRGSEPVRIRARRSYGRGSSQAFVQGRVVLDGIHTLRSSFVRLESYSLESAAREILGKSKTHHGSPAGRRNLADLQGGPPPACRIQPERLAPGP